MGDVQSRRPYAKASARVFLAVALAASMSLPFAGAIPAVADEPAAPVAEPGAPVDPATGQKAESPVGSSGPEVVEPSETENPLAAEPAASASTPLAAAGQAPADESQARAGEQQAVFTVTRADDDSALGEPTEGTLRWAIAQANAAGSESYTVKIAFADSLQGGVIEIQEELPTIKRPMVIDGPGGGVTIRKDEEAPIDEGWRHFRIDRNEGTGDFEVVMNNLTLQGPGQQKANELLENGGIFVDEEFTGSLSLVNCTLEGNVNDRGSDLAEGENPDGMSHGGAINVQSEWAELRLTNCTVADNKAHWYGGGVYTISPIIAESSRFERNRSWNASGGGLLAAEKAELTRCVILDNVAGNESGGVQGGDLAMTECEVSGNESGTKLREHATGGGVGAINLTMTDCTVTDNVSGVGGGVYCSGRVAMKGSTVADNTSTTWGGGLLVVDGGVIEDCDITGNSTSLAGGGIAVGYESAEQDPTAVSDLTVNGGTISGNVSSDNGGGIFMYHLCDLVLNDVVVSGNTAARAGGGVYGEAPSTPVAAADEEEEPAATLTVSGGEIVGNKAEGKPQGEGDEGTGNGGGVCLPGGPVTIENGTVSGNESAENGGGIFALSATVRNSTLEQNKAAGSGGGLCALAARIESSRLSANKAGYAGGGLSAEVAIVDATTLDANSAPRGGGVSATDAGLVNCTLSGNAAEWAGGGLTAQDAVLANCTLSGNTARASDETGSFGGGVYVAKLEMHGCLVAGNHDHEGKPSEVRVDDKSDNGTGAVTDTYGKKNLIGVPAAGLSAVMATETANGVEVGKLADNGGATPTIMITPDGPAQDVILAGDYQVPSVDQRGNARPFGPATDVGAVEVSGLSKTYEVLKPFGPYRGGNESLSAAIDGPGRSVTGVEIAGRQLEPGTHYTVGGDAAIELKPAFLRTLKNGSYDVTVAFTNGHAQLSLKVDLTTPKPVDPEDPKPNEDVKKKPVPLARTGDGTGPAGWAALLAASAAVAAIGVAKRRRS